MDLPLGERAVFSRNSQGRGKNNALEEAWPLSLAEKAW